MANRYVVETTADVALAAATAKTILAYICGTNAPARVTELAVSFDGISASAEPVTIELCKSTQAGAGTTTSQSPVQVGGAARTVQGTGARNYSAEPTVLTVIKRWLCHPQAGMVVQFPLGREPEQVTSAQGFAVRCTAPAIVNAQGYIEVEEG